jgi:hypothetical protein
MGLNRINAVTRILCLVWAMPGLAWSDSQVSVTTGLDYSSGRYGTANTTEIWYLPVIGKLETGNWQFKLVVPYLRMRAPSGGVIVGYDSNGTPIRSGVGEPVTVSGQGDVVASASYALVSSPRFMLDVTTKLKVGTASRDKGLGTGKNDVALVLDAYFPIDKLTPFISVGYKKPGDPPGQDIHNTRQAEMGLAYKFSPSWSAGVMYDWRSASSSAGSHQRDLSAYAVYKLASDWKMQAYVSQGLSEASADYGGGMMVTRSF